MGSVQVDARALSYENLDHTRAESIVSGIEAYVALRACATYAAHSCNLFLHIFHTRRDTRELWLCSTSSDHTHAESVTSGIEANVVLRTLAHSCNHLRTIFRTRRDAIKLWLLHLHVTIDIDLTEEPVDVYGSRHSPSELLSGDGPDVLLACMRLGVDELRRWREASGESAVVEKGSLP